MYIDVMGMRPDPDEAGLPSVPPPLPPPGLPPPVGVPPPVGATPVDEGDVGGRGSGKRVSVLDSWEPVIAKHAWVRRHLVQRTSLFVPTRAEDGPDVTTLSNVRVTHVMFSDGTMDIIRDDWKSADDSRRVLPMAWTGEAWFFCRVTNRARPRLGARIESSNDLALMFLSRTCLPDCVPVLVSIGKV